MPTLMLTTYIEQERIWRANATATRFLAQADIWGLEGEFLCRKLLEA
jgi:hypothetical protein